MALKRLEPITKSASEPSPAQVVGLLKSIFQQAQTQLTVPPLEGAAQEAFNEFQRIKGGLALTQKATINLVADKTVINAGDPVILSWTSTNAARVSIDASVGDDIGEVTPPEAGSVEVRPTVETTFTATATGSCSAPTASVTVSILDVGIARGDAGRTLPR